MRRNTDARSSSEPIVSTASNSRRRLRGPACSDGIPPRLYVADQRLAVPLWRQTVTPPSPDRRVLRPYLKVWFRSGSRRPNSEGSVVSNGIARTEARGASEGSGHDEHGQDEGAAEGETQVAETVGRRELEVDEAQDEPPQGMGQHRAERDSERG